MKIFIEINGSIDSKSLWQLIGRYKVNLTDCIDKTYIYGDVDTIIAAEVIVCCALYGNLKIELSQGGQK